jgi:hypothetical protein
MVCFLTAQVQEGFLDLRQRLRIEHYVNSQGFFVFTERAHLQRGSCCGSGCLHCPFQPRGKKGTTALAAEVAALIDEQSH